MASVSESSMPALSDVLMFRLKATVFQMRRSWMNGLNPVQRFEKCDRLIDSTVIARSITPLWTSHETYERNLIAGKIHNLRLAAQQIHGIELSENSTFSFWAQVGKPTAKRGYVSGRELRQGCVIPSVGGGLCQLSNALYSAALDAGLEIVERHAHTQVIPGSLAEIGRDATVFWNYVDLRFKTTKPLRIEVQLTSDALIVEFRGQRGVENSIESEPARSTIKHTKSCQSCGVTSCLRSTKSPSIQMPVAYLLDEYWAEFDQFIQQERKSSDLLAVPIDGKQWRKGNYAWNFDGFGTVKQARSITLKRAIASRNLPAQGQSRQQLLFDYDQQLATAYAKHLSYNVLHCVVMQNLLPFLWQEGHLGGRTFDVLMTRSPMFALQEQLDQAYQDHPESPTLNDFRVDQALLESERQALEVAQRIVTPHRAIAKLFPEKTVLLDWQLPQAKSIESGDAILFPASTLGRKGAYELRQVARNLGLKIRVLGKELEGEDFWQDVEIERVPGDPLAGVGLVVLPAYVEHRPRILLRAIALGIPVIASEACGLNEAGIAVGDEKALQSAIELLQNSTAVEVYESIH